MSSQITSLTFVYSTVYSGADQRKHQSSASSAFVRGINRWPVNSPHKGPVTLIIIWWRHHAMIFLFTSQVQEGQTGPPWNPTHLARPYAHPGLPHREIHRWETYTFHIFNLNHWHLHIVTDNGVTYLYRNMRIKSFRRCCRPKPLWRCSLWNSSTCQHVIASCF